MPSGIKTKQLRIGGMTCINCQNIIERKLKSAAGVKAAKVDYTAGTAEISYDNDIISLKDISAIVEKLDYEVLPENSGNTSSLRRVTGVLIIIVLLYMLLQQLNLLNLLVPSQLADTKMGYGMLFVIGLLTSVHCIAMCGGINLSQCIPHSVPADSTALRRIDTFLPAFLYNLGRVLSYTAIGFILGFAGFIFGGGADSGLSAVVQGILKMAAGVFMVIMGLNMLSLFPSLRKLQPRIPSIFTRKAVKGKERNNSPLFVGLLNGLMPCGPLQSMQIVALASGNPVTGALSMFLFSLGTVPLMLGFGSFISVLGKKFTAKVMNIGAVLVVVLGLAMLSQGGSLSGLLLPTTLLGIIFALCAIGIISLIPFPRTAFKIISMAAAVIMISAAVRFTETLSAYAGGDVNIVEGMQIVNSTLMPGSYPDITVKAGTPVKWIINAPEGSINGCNNRIHIQEYDIFDYTFEYGDNVIEFTPEKTGQFQYSCWMGMIRANITVVDESDTVTELQTR